MKRTNDPNNPRERALDDALALWAEDARAAGARTDADTLARAVAARIAADPQGVALERAPFGYAAAAAALLAVGLTGAFLAGPERASAAPPSVSSDVEQGSLAVIRLVELEQIPVGR